MDLRKIQYFFAVVEHGNLSSAARSLRVSQPTLSRQVQAIEEQFQAPLFLRGGRGMMLTDAGKRFAHLETDARKKLFAEHLLKYVPVVGLIRRVLDERPSHTAPAARFRNELEDYMSEDYADETLKTIVSWARYAELFAYDEQSETFSLENPH